MAVLPLLSIKEYEEVPKLVLWHAEATLYNLHGEDILDVFTPNGYNNAVEAEWDVAKARVIPEGEQMARDMTNANDHNWITDQNLNELLGNDKVWVVAWPERETPRAQFDFDNDSHHTFGFGGGGHQMETSNETVDQDEEWEQMPSGNGTSATAMAPTFNVPPDKINPVSQCDKSTLGNPTTDSHMSQMEQRVDSMSQNLSLILLLLQKKGTENSSKMDTQPVEDQKTAGMAEMAPVGRGWTRPGHRLIACISWHHGLGVGMAREPDQKQHKETADMVIRAILASKGKAIIWITTLAAHWVAGRRLMGGRSNWHSNISTSREEQYQQQEWVLMMTLGTPLKMKSQMEWYA